MGGCRENELKKRVGIIYSSAGASASSFASDFSATVASVRYERIYLTNQTNLSLAYLKSIMSGYHGAIA